MINPSNGERLRVEKAVEAGFVAAAFKKHLLLAEQSVFGFETSTGSLLPLFEAMKIGLIPQGMAYRIMEVQFVTGGLICPRRCHRKGSTDQNRLVQDWRSMNPWSQSTNQYCSRIWFN